MKKINKLVLMITLFATIALTSCYQREIKPTESISSAAPTMSIIKREITLLSNFDPNREHGFTLEGLVNPANTQAFFDFDKGEITNTDNADIYLDVSCGTNCFNGIININGAKSVEIGEVEPGVDGCLTVLQEDRLRASIVPGIYSCVYTNDGNIVQILAIENEAYSKNAKFVFEYVIWYQNR
jgi:hypothetical protein